MDTPQNNGQRIIDKIFHHVFDTGEFSFFDSSEFQIPLFGWITKFEVLEVMAAVIICALFIPLARRLRDGSLPRGPLANALDSTLLYIRDEVARPAIGAHDADRYLPFLWTMFLFILGCNLLGMVPFLGSPTASIWVTGALALVAFVVIHAFPIAHNGPLGYLKAYVPHIDLGESLGMKLFGMVLTGFMFIIEVLGAFIRSTVLAIRLFANMFAGHTVLSVILVFIFIAHEALQANVLIGGEVGFWGITAVSVASLVALSLLELFIAFLQAFIFTFLTSLFIGLALHPEH
jgi:F-type H+-transporting ATPase subunit a